VADFKRASPKITHIVDTVPDLTPDLARIGCATLVIWGEQDLTLDPRSFPRLVEKLPAATGCPVRGSGHQPHLAKPGLVNRRILDFLYERRNKM
jgi:pimeloyl-ACP methyl ester carboxylesterase